MSLIIHVSENALAILALASAQLKLKIQCRNPKPELVIKRYVVASSLTLFGEDGQQLGDHQLIQPCPNPNDDSGGAG